ncbi:MAG: TerD family protein [Chitinophagales bacterium]|nr:TerD family protein [Chitinophagales bacterium]
MQTEQSATLLVNNSIYLRRAGKLFLVKESNSLDRVYIAALLKNIEKLGYILSPELIEVVSTFSMPTLSSFYQGLVADLKLLVGAHVRFDPMYPNFPQQVIDTPEDELYLNAAVHYLGDWIGARILPLYNKIARPGLEDVVVLKVIELGCPEDFENILVKLLAAKTSITDTDKLDVEWFVFTYKNSLTSRLPTVIPLKENVAILGAYIWMHAPLAADKLKEYIKTATDVLRLAVAMSGGDVSLAENTKFRNFSKPERRWLLALLEDCGNITEDMLRYKNRWKRLGERLHPFEYKKQFGKCFEAFDVIRNDKPFKTFNSKVESCLAANEIAQTAGLLKSRPGEFARRLDNLLRLSDQKSDVLKAFDDLAAKVSNPVLWQVLAHFKHRNEPKELRTFFPKGNVGKAKSISNRLPLIPDEICRQVVVICENKLVEKYSKLPPLQNVYLDKELKNYTIPFALRSASKALNTISRGSRITIPEGNTLRFFIWWKDGNERTDIDLSAVGLDADCRYKTDIAYYNLKTFGGHHSGDITSAPNGASEFIDIDIEKFLSSGIRYVVMCVNSFTYQPYCDLPECFAGLMIRQFANSGEIYEPKSVRNKFDLTSNTRVAIPLIIDLADRKIIWTDMALTNVPSHQNNVYNNMPSITILAKAMTALVKPSLYELFELHTRARGLAVPDIESANTIFATDKGIKPTDTGLIISDYL